MVVVVAVVVCVMAVAMSGAFAASANEKQNNYLKRTGLKYLEEKAKESGIFKLKSGMLVEILHENKDESALSPTSGDSCEVTYKGTLKDGTQFDAGTTSFAPNQVIKGWTEAMQMMVAGDKWKLYIPYDLAYGERGSPPKIGPYSTLIFEIEIHKVKAKGKSAKEAREMFSKALASADGAAAEL